MDLERLQVVISANVKPLENALKSVNKKLNGVNDDTNKIEKSINNATNAAVEGINKAITSANKYSQAIKNIAKQTAKYQLFGKPEDQPWKVNIREMRQQYQNLLKDVEKYEAEMSQVLYNNNNDADNLTLGYLAIKLGDARDGAEQLDAILTELFADMEKTPEDWPLYKLNSGLIEMAEEAHKVKKELIDLTIKSQELDASVGKGVDNDWLSGKAAEIKEVEAEIERLTDLINLAKSSNIEGTRYNEFLQANENLKENEKSLKEYQAKLASLNKEVSDYGAKTAQGWQQARQAMEANNEKVIELTNRYAVLRREIDAAIETMGGLEHRRQIPVFNISQYIPQMKQFAELFKIIATGAYGAYKATTRLGSVLWQMEPLHKILKRLGDSLKSLGVRIKRVLVYSTIVSFFRAVKNQISSYLTANAELMGALGQAKGAWITAFMPILNYVIPKIIALINWLTILGQKIAMLTARIFGGSVKASQQQAKALQAMGGAAGGAAAEFKPMLAAFDELNRLEEPDAGGGGAGADLSEPTFDFDESELKDYLTWYDWLYDKTERLLEIHKKLDTWLQKCAKSINWFADNMYQMFRGDNLQMAEAMTHQFEELGRTLAEALNRFVSAVNWERIGQALGAGLDLALSWLVSFIYTFDWRNLASSIASAINGAISEINWNNVGKVLAGYWNVVWQAFVGFVTTIDWTSLGTAIADTINGALTNIDIKSFEEGVRAVCDGIFQGFVAIVENLDWALLAQKIIELFIAALRGAVTVNNLDLLFFGLGSTMSDKTTEGFESGKPEFEKSIDDGIGNAEQRFQKGWHSINTDTNEQWARTRSDIAEKIDGIQSDSTTKFDTIKSKLSATSQNTKTAVIGAFQTLSSGISPVLSSIAGAFSSAWGSIVSDTSSKFSSLVSTVGGAVATIGQSISGMLSSIGSGISSAWGSITGFVSSALAQLAQVKIPAMASGGVITQPTVGLVGEYAGARHNPEIVTPENLLRNIIHEGNDDTTETMIQIGRQIVEAINNNTTEIKIGDDVISAAAARGNKEFQRRTGRSQFA